MERGSINEHTPLEWLHVRIEPLGNGLFSLRTYMLNGTFSKTDLKAMHLADRSTENLPKAEATALGARIEKWLKAQNTR